MADRDNGRLHAKALRDQLFLAHAEYPPDDPIAVLRSDVDFQEGSPIILFRKASSANVKRSVLHRVIFRFTTLPDNGMRFVAIFDPTDRYASGGQLAVSRGSRPGWVSTSGNQAEMIVRYGSAGELAPEIVATSPADAQARICAEAAYVLPLDANASPGEEVVLNFDSRAWIEKTGTVLVYAWVLDPGFSVAKFAWEAEFSEERIS